MVKALMNPNRTYQVKLTVPFHDLDPLHVVWHGNYLKYFDIARFGLFKDAGIDLYAYSQKNSCFFPITKTTTKLILKSDVHPTIPFVRKDAVIRWL